MNKKYIPPLCGWWDQERQKLRFGSETIFVSICYYTRLGVSGESND